MVLTTSAHADGEMTAHKTPMPKATTSEKTVSNVILSSFTCRVRVQMLGLVRPRITSDRPATTNSGSSSGCL